MMKKIILVATTLATFALLQGCTPKTAGMDTAYLNKNRGAEGAQISREEAAQYSRQQRLSADEVRLENMKRHQTTDSITEKANAASSVTNAARNLNWMLKGW
jgi:hypothetical protein